MQVGDLVKVTNRFTRTSQVGIITKCRNKKQLPNSFLVFFANTEKQWDWFPYYDLELVCK